MDVQPQNHDALKSDLQILKNIKGVMNTTDDRKVP